MAALPSRGGGPRTLLSSYVQYAVSCPEELRNLLPEQPSSSLFDVKLTRQMDTREIVPAAVIPVYPALPDRAFRAFITRRAPPAGAARRGSADSDDGVGAAAAAEHALSAQLENFDFRDIPHLTSAERAFLDGLDTPLFARYQREVTEAFHAAAKAEVAKARAAERRITGSGLFDKDVTNTRVRALVAVDVVPRRGAANLHAVAHRVLRRFMAAVRRGTLAADAGALDDDFIEDVAPPEVPGAGARRQSSGPRRHSSGGAAAEASLPSAAAATAAAVGGVAAPHPQSQTPPPPSALGLVAQDIGVGARTSPSPGPDRPPPADDALLRSAHALHVWKAQAGRALEDGPGMRRIWAAERGIHPTAASLQQAVRAAAASVSTLVPAAAGRAAAAAASSLPTSLQQRRAELYADYGAHSGDNSAGRSIPDAQPGGLWSPAPRQTEPPVEAASSRSASSPLLSIAAMQTRLQGASLTEQARRRRAARAAANAAALGAALSPGAGAAAAAASPVSALVRVQRSGGGAAAGDDRAGGDILSPLVVERGIVRLPATLGVPDARPGIDGGEARTAFGGNETQAAPAGLSLENTRSHATLPLPADCVSVTGLSESASDVGGTSDATLRRAGLRPRSPSSPTGPPLLRPLSRAGSALSLLHSSRHAASVVGGPLPRVDSLVASRAARGGGAGLRRGAPGSVASAESAAAFSRATPAFHRPEVLDAVAALTATPAARVAAAAAAGAATRGSAAKGGNASPGAEAAGELRRLRASASSVLLQPLSETALAAADTSLGLPLATRDVSASQADTMASGLRGSIASLRRAVEASLRLEAPVADRIVALGVTNGARIGPLASPLRPVRAPKVVALPRPAPSLNSGGRPVTADSAADTASVSGASARPGTSATARGTAAGGGGVASLAPPATAPLESLLEEEEKAAAAARGAVTVVDGLGSSASAGIVAGAALSSPDASAAAAPHAAGELTHQLVHIMDLLEMPARDRAGFVARYSGSRERAGGLRDACALWEDTAEGVVHVEVLKHALAHAHNAREALALALRIAKQDAPGDEADEEPVIWVPVIPAATLRFAAARGTLSPDDAEWAAEQLALTPADAQSAYFLWSLPTRIVQAGAGSNKPPPPATPGGGSAGAEPEADEEESVAAVAAAAVIAGRASFPPPPVHGPRVAFRPVFRSGAGGASLTAVTLSALAAARDGGGGEAGRRSRGPSSSFHLRMQAQEPSVAELAASEARIAAILESASGWLSDACLRITGAFGDAVAFRGVSVLAALRREARAGLIPDSDLSAALRDDAPGGAE